MIKPTRINLRKHHLELFNSAYILDEKRPLVEWYVKRMMPNVDRYRRIASEVQVPWWVIAVIHSLEASLDFSKNIQNGQPLNQITTIVPVGLKPFDTWEDSVRYEFLVNRKKIIKTFKWDLADCLFFLESHNGFGYYYKQINTPYLWSFTNQYVTGLFTKDSKFEGDKVSNNAGACALLLGLIEKDLVTYGDLFGVSSTNQEPTENKPPQAGNVETIKPIEGIKKGGTIMDFFKKVIEFLYKIFKRKKGI